MIQKIEGYFMKELSEKAGRIAVLSLFLLIPDYRVRMIFLLLTATSLLPADVHHKRVSSLAALPFSHGDMYWVSYLFLATIVTVTQFIGGGLFGMHPSVLGYHWLGSINFATAYFSIAMLCVMAGLDHFGIPLLIFFGDLILGGIGNRGMNPYFYISPVHQGNVFLSMPVAFGLLVLSAYLFIKKGVTK